MPLDPSQFLEGSIVGESSTEFILIPAEEFVATAKKIFPPRFLEMDDGRKSLVMDYQFKLDDSDGKIEKLTNRKDNFVRYSLFVDCTDESTPESPRVDMRKGVNVALGRFRAACGKNDPNKPFKWTDLLDIPVQVLLRHETNKETGDILPKVAMIGKLGEKIRKEKTK